MSRKVKRLVGAFCAATLAMFESIGAENAGQSGMAGQIMMRYGFSFEGKSFEASRWFKNGMYKRRPTNSTSSGFSEWGMTRVSPLPFKDSDLLDVRVWLVVGLDPITDDIPGLARVPDDYEEILMDSRFDPRPQIHYSTSYFKEPDFPVDIYGCYLLIKGKRFFVDLERDGRTGKFVGASRTDSVTGISYTEQKKLFKELEKRQAQAQQKPQSPPPVASQQAEQQAEPVSYTVPGGSRCPRTGWWYTHVDGGKPRFFREGEIFPEFPPDPSYWQWGHETPPKP